MVRRDASRVRCFTRNGHDLANRFSVIVDAAHRIKASSFLIDGEAVVCREDGISDFDALRSCRRDYEVTLIAFDLIEWQGDDLRDQKLIDRKNRLAKMLARGGGAIQFNEHLAHDGPAVFEHACRLGLEGIVSKRLDSPYRSGPSKVWLKSKNPQVRSRAVRARGRLELIFRLSLSQIDADCLDLPGLRIRPRFKTHCFAFGDFIAFLQR
jgi:bifunctional non-homologous end joining protein LigD